MENCRACGKPAKKMVGAMVTTSPGTGVFGRVCGSCASTGVLVVVGDDRSDADQVPVTPQTPTGLPKLKKEGFGLRVSDPPPTAAVPKGELLILTHLFVNGALSRRQVGLVTGYSKNTRNTYLARLLAKGHIESHGDAFVNTQSGSQEVLACGSQPEVPKLGRELLRWWKARLPAGECSILSIFTEHPGVRVLISRSEITARTGYSKNTRNTYVARLVSKFLIERVGNDLRAVSELFDGSVS